MTSSVRWLGQVLGVTCAYFALGWLARLFATPPGYASIVWPAAGVALAAALLSGSRLWPGVALGSFLLNWSIEANQVGGWRSAGVTLPALIAAGSVAQAFYGARLAQRWLGLPLLLVRPREIGLFVLLAGPLHCVVNASWSVTWLTLCGVKPWSDFFINWFSWWLGDSLGCFVTILLILPWWSEPRSVWRPRRALVGVPMLISLIATGAFFFLLREWERPGLAGRLSAGGSPSAIYWTIMVFGFVMTSVLGTTQLTVTGKAFLAGEEAQQRTAELARSEATKRAMFDAMPDLMVLLDAAGCVLEVHATRTEGLQVSPGAIVGRTLDDILPAEVAAPMAPRIEQARQGGTPPLLEYALTIGPGKTKSYEARFAPCPPDRVLVIAREVSDQKRLSEDLRASEERFRNFFELSLDPCGIAGPDGCFWQVNSAFERVLGFSRAEICSQPFFAFIHPADLEKTTGQFLRLKSGGEVVDFENRYRRKDGSYRWLQWRATPMTPNGLVYAIARDITENKLLALLMHQTHSAAHIGGWELDFTTDRMFWTEETYRIHDIPPEEYSPTVESALAFYAPEGRAVIADAVRRGKELGESWDLELRLITARGRSIWVHAVGKIEMEAGQPTKAVGTIQDVTDRKQAQLALQEANEQLEQRVQERTWALEKAYSLLKAAMDATADGLLAVDRQGEPVIANGRFYDMWNMPASLMAGPPNTHALVAAAQANLRDPQTFVRTMMVLKDHPDQESVDLVAFLDGRVFERVSRPQMIGRESVGRVWSFRDITERQQAEKRVLASLQEKEVLLKEVHHRVKNNLQIITSLLSLQVDQVSDARLEAALRESQNRVRSMALIHETLYQSHDLARIDMASYIDSLCSQLYRSYAIDPGRVAMTIAADDIRLDLDRAIPCGLLLNEAITNALKHGFPDQRAGAIQVTFTGAASAGYELCVRDDGVGLPADFDHTRSESLGFQLICTLAKQLDGVLDLRGDHGLTLRLAFRPRSA